MASPLTGKVGGLPTWAWLGAGGATFALWFVLRRKGPQASTTGGDANSSSTVPLGQAYPSTIPVIIPSNDPFNTGLPASVTAPATGTATSSDGGAAVVPPPVAAPPSQQPNANTNPWIKNDPGGGWPSFVAGGSWQTQAVESLFYHYLGRGVENQGVMDEYVNAINQRGFAAVRASIMQSPEARNFAAGRSAQGMGVAA